MKDDCQKMVKETIDQLGGLDVVISNAVCNSYFVRWS